MNKIPYKNHPSLTNLDFVIVEIYSKGTGFDLGLYFWAFNLSNRNELIEFKLEEENSTEIPIGADMLLGMRLNITENNLCSEDGRILGRKLTGSIILLEPEFLKELFSESIAGPLSNQPVFIKRNINLKE